MLVIAQKGEISAEDENLVSDNLIRILNINSKTRSGRIETLNITIINCFELSKKYFPRNCKNVFSRNCNKSFSKNCNKDLGFFPRILKMKKKKNPERIKNALHKMMQHYIIHYMSQTAMRLNAS